ncbi:hypothetical protein K8S19_11365 [bacterium]|nr:hypothetical protein [bacterium]
MRETPAKRRGCFFNLDADMTDALSENLLVNEDRYVCLFCSCRLSVADYVRDRDLICSCNYRFAAIFAFVRHCRMSVLFVVSRMTVLSNILSNSFNRKPLS